MVSNASMSTFSDNTLNKFTTLLPQSLVLHCALEVALVELSWPGLIESVTEGLFSFQLNREKRDTLTQKSDERPGFGNGMVSIYALTACSYRTVLRLKKNLNLRSFFHDKRLLQFGQLYPSLHVRQPLQKCWLRYQSIATELGHSRSIPVTAPQIHQDFKSKIKNPTKAVSKDLKNTLEYSVDCSQTNDEDKQLEGSLGLEVPRDSQKTEKKLERSEMTEQT